MGIFRRINDIISANFNDMVEGFEDPDQMLRQAIREMEQSISEATRDTAKALASQKLLEKELASNRRQAAEWQSRAEQAVAAGDDDLARKALGRKQDNDRVIAALADQLASAEEATASLKRQLEAMKAKLAEAKRSLATLSARQRAADFRKRAQSQAPEFAKDLNDDAFAKFDRLRGRVEQAEAEAEAMAELSDGAAPASDEIEASDTFSTSNDDVEAALASLKAKHN